MDLHLFSPAGFDELMPKTIANATVDRLMHHAHVVLTAGDSIRLTQATTGKGVFETLKAVAKGVLSDLKKLGR